MKFYMKKKVNKLIIKITQKKYMQDNNYFQVLLVFFEILLSCSHFYIFVSFMIIYFKYVIVFHFIFLHLVGHIIIHSYISMFLIWLSFFYSLSIL